MNKRCNNPNVSKMVIEEFTELRKQPIPKFVWSINPMHDHWVKDVVDEYLKDKHND